MEQISFLWEKTASRLEFEKLSVFKLPSTVLLQPPYGYNGLDDFYPPLKDWATRNPDFTQPNDINSISYLSLPLSMSFQRIVIAVKDNAVESVQRRNVDDLVEMAFSGRPGCTHIVNIEHSVRLRTSRPTVAVNNAHTLNIPYHLPPTSSFSSLDLTSGPATNGNGYDGNRTGGYACASPTVVPLSRSNTALYLQSLSHRLIILVAIPQTVRNWRARISMYF